MPEIELDLRKTVRQNLQERYAELRKLKEKKAGLLKAMEETEKEMKALEEETEKRASSTATKNSKTHSNNSKSKKRKSSWHDPYLFFLTSGGHRVVAGKDAKQNDELYSKHLMTGDLFFHADIQGAPATILKDGQKADEQEKKETAQWAASYSSAWKTGASAVDVYALMPDQVGKHADGGYVGRGAFVLSGEREWFRETVLTLKIGWKEETDDIPTVLPACHPLALQNQLILSPGPVPKEETAKALAGKLGAKADEIAPKLPGGKFVIK